jgi:hypothetical protein
MDIANYGVNIKMADNTEMELTQSHAKDLPVRKIVESGLAVIVGTGMTVVNSLCLNEMANNNVPIQDETGWLMLGVAGLGIYLSMASFGAVELYRSVTGKTSSDDYSISSFH